MDELAARQDDQPSLISVAAKSDAPAGMRVGVFGDSVAWSYVQNVTPAILEAHHTAALGDYARWYCQLFDLPRHEGKTVRAPDDGCADWRTRWAGDLAKNQPDVVVFNVGVWEIFDRQFDTGWTTFGTPAFDTRLAAVLDEAMVLLSSTGARLVVPTAPYPERHPGPAMGAPEWTQENGGRPRIDHFNDLLRQAADRHQALVVELAAHICPTPNGPCQAGLRPDGVHFDTNTSADPILGWILDRAWADRTATQS